ncbi:MAG TPA: enoyl-CoA hydratase-related protein [Noviherbaspirillum sp.]|uniref:enoyl-CoA hydratase/isomerase family protein n=1 Tax=Noviherbaspirillum sp. TaxID=1926288 RepID=UPI002B484F9D|nr:enoyl-CoA hydratase-related protein [Noviherbaspirillum sp.]HJV84984.1 enoyl-CoA hydratase-related protein [Noviherbaspirillum sp.]
MEYQHYKRLKIEQADGVLTVALSQPERRNAMDEIMHREIPELWRQISQDRSVRVVILKGDPEGKAFCAGGDLKWVSEAAQSGERYEEILRDGVDIVRGVAQLPQPVITMINGSAIGVGASLALFGDIVFADEAAVIADPHVSVGVVAGDGGAIIWPLLVGPNRAKEFLMTGDPLTGAQAERIGLVNHAVPAGELQERVENMARRLANGPRLAIELTKRSVNIQVNTLVNHILHASLALEGLTFRTQDHHTAVNAFLSRSRPSAK